MSGSKRTMFVVAFTLLAVFAMPALGDETTILASSPDALAPASGIPEHVSDASAEVLQSQQDSEAAFCPADTPQTPELELLQARPRLRTCVCSCGEPCRTDADCGPGGRCGPGITCC
jgi:hypothetical protein